jgi:hypothetical protein
MPGATHLRRDLLQMIREFLRLPPEATGSIRRDRWYWFRSRNRCGESEETGLRTGGALARQLRRRCSVSLEWTITRRVGQILRKAGAGIPAPASLAHKREQSRWRVLASDCDEAADCGSDMPAGERLLPFSPSCIASFNLLTTQAQLGGDNCWPRGRPPNNLDLVRCDARTENPFVPRDCLRLRDRRRRRPRQSHRRRPVRAH